MSRVYVALGGNIDPEVRLSQAARLLRAEFPDIRFSASFRNAAVGFVGDDFINAVAGFSTDLPVPLLLERLHSIEETCGRSREDPKWGPRAMDIDLLLYGDQVGEGPGYRLPRPDLLRRPYMLGPLAGLEPGLVHPLAGRSMAALWSELQPGQSGLVPSPPDLNAV